jgi:hypothetical protein
VVFLTNSASALPISPPSRALMRCSSTQLVPLASTITGLPVAVARKSRDLTIWPGRQPSARAASAAVRVEAGSSTTLNPSPR